MAFSPATQRWVHHKDCTWCIHKQEKPVGMVGKKVLVGEFCELTEQSTPAPYQPGRYCERYVQVECGCPACLAALAPIGV